MFVHHYEKFEMHSTYTQAVISARLFLLSVFGLVYIPHDFWSQVVVFLDIPPLVKVIINPLFGAIVGTIAEYFYDYEKRRKARAAGKTAEEPVPVFHWPLKIIASWIAGVFGGNIGTDIFKGSPENIAFFSGITAYAGIAVYLAQQQQKIHDSTQNKDDVT